MSKYSALWEFLSQSGKDSLTLTFDEIEQIAEIPMDHAFLKYKKELLQYNYRAEQISLKAKTVRFQGNLIPVISQEIHF